MSVEKAKKLCVNPDDIPSFNKGRKKLQELAISNLLPLETRVKAITALGLVDHVTATDVIDRIRDSLKYLSYDETEPEITFLLSVVREPAITSHTRTIVAHTLFAHGFIEYVWPCFEYLAQDNTLEQEYRVEAIRYLYYSGDKNYLDMALFNLLQIIDDTILPSHYRYGIIAGFATGRIIPFLNFSALKAKYNEEFCMKLQKVFYNNKKNGIRERILSGQHLLQMKTFTEKDIISQELIDIAMDDSIDENIRADAADVVMREGVEEFKAKAMGIIEILGNGEIKSAPTTIYTNRQNVHSVSDAAEEFILKLFDTDEPIDDYSGVHSEVSKLITKAESLTSKERGRALKSIQRISIDTARFTKRSITSADVFIKVWMYIKRHEERDELTQRLIEELVEMADTCSTGHATRLINVLSYYETTLKISWKDQIHANFHARVQAKIKNLDDEDLKGEIVLGMMEDAEEESRKIYEEFMAEITQGVREELYGEFVGDGYINEKEFTEWFDEAKS